jgi:uncharacterized membrane protein YraQ (UPF0718 family)
MRMPAYHKFLPALQKTFHGFLQMFPIIIGMLLMTSILVTLFPRKLITQLLGQGNVADSLIASGIGSIAAGHPIASYLVAGELLSAGAGLVAVTAFIVAWVTVGIVQLPAEAMLLGVRFALWRNLICFLSSIAIAYLVVFTLMMTGFA